MIIMSFTLRLKQDGALGILLYLPFNDCQGLRPLTTFKDTMKFNPSSCFAHRVTLNSNLNTVAIL